VYQKLNAGTIKVEEQDPAVYATVTIDGTEYTITLVADSEGNTIDPADVMSIQEGISETNARLDDIVTLLKIIAG